MKEIKNIKNKIKKEKEKLKKYENSSFNKRKNGSLRRHHQKQKKMTWKANKIIIKGYLKKIALFKQKVNFTILGKLLLCSDKTAKKYYELFINNQDLEYQRKNYATWNSDYDLRIKVINALYAAIEITDKHMGQLAPPPLSDLIDDIEEDYNFGKKLKY